LSDIEEVNRRFAHHDLDEFGTRRVEAVRLGCHTLAGLLGEMCPPGRELSLAYNKLEQVMFLANAAIARQAPQP
jgi:hypothetical protein